MNILAISDRTIWTEERVAELRRLRHERKSIREIAKIFGLTRNAICGKLNRLGIPAPVRAPPPKKREIRPRAMPPVSAKGVSILGLSQDTCRWPLWSDGAREGMYCGKAPEVGLPYCEGHCRMAYSPSRSAAR